MSCTETQGDAAFTRFLSRCPWPSKRFALLLTRRREIGAPEAQLLSVFLERGVVPRAEGDGNNNRPGDDLSKYLVVKPGDLVFNKLRTWQGGFGASRFYGIVSPAYFVCESHCGMEPRFVDYLLHSHVYLAELTRISKWMPPSQFDIAWEDLRTLQIATPTKTVQRAIVNFLDRETAEADARVTKYERLIELLEEKRVSLITRAVTKGIDPNVPMKDSGYTWVPSVPSHWSVTPLKHITSIPITDGPHETPEFVLGGIPFVSAEAVSSGRIDFTKTRGYISSRDHDRYSQKYSPLRGDIFIIKSGATTGISAIVDTDTLFDIWSPLAAVRCGSKALAPYVLQVIRSRVFQDSIALHWNYGTQQNIGMSVLENLPVPLPPVAEQRTLLEHMSEHIAKIEATQNLARSAIALTGEHRAALITAAVTGQIDVSNYRSKQEPVEVPA